MMLIIMVRVVVMMISTVMSRWLIILWIMIAIDEFIYNAIVPNTEKHMETLHINKERKYSNQTQNKHNMMNEFGRTPNLIIFHGISNALRICFTTPKSIIINSITIHEREYTNQ